MRRIYVIAGIVLLFAAIVFVVLRSDDDAPETLVPEGAVGAENNNMPETGDDPAGGEDSTGFRGDAGSGDVTGAQAAPSADEPLPNDPRRVVTEEELREVDIEQQERERLERVEEFHAEHGGPISCETVCDCPDGLDCRIPPGICVPSGRNVYCCTDDTCPDGDQCTQPNGRIGTCGDN